MPATPANAGTARALAVLFLVALALAEVAAALEVDSPDEVVVAPEVEEDAEDCRQSKVSFWCSKLRRIEDSGSRNEVRKDTSDDLR